MEKRIMKKVSIALLFLLFLVVDVYAAYTAPNEDTVVVVGGLGTQANKHQINGGGATKAVWDAGSPSDFINTNGGPITTAADCTFTTATKVLASVGIGTGVTVGTLAYVSAGDGLHITAGIYEVTAQTNDSITCAQIDDDGTNDTGVTVNVGGALDGLKNALDEPVNNGASYNRYIYDNIATETITATIDVDTYAGTTSTRIFIIGYNSTLTAKAEIIITTASDLDNGLLKFDGSKLYYVFDKIDFNAGGKDGNLGEYCINDVGPDSDYISYVDCKFHGAVSHGVYNNSDYLSFANCEFYLNGGDGINNDATDGFNNQYLACSFHDNDGHGLNQAGSSGIIVGCLAYDNGKDGTGHGIFLISSSADSVFVIGNTCYGNASDGLNIDNLAYACFIANNSCVGNGDYGYNLQGIKTGFAFFGYNHAYNNDQNAGIAAGADYCSETASEALFQTFRNGNNKTGDPKFTSVVDGSEDFTPETGSDLIDNALDAGTN